MSALNVRARTGINPRKNKTNNDFLDRLSTNHLFLYKTISNQHPSFYIGSNQRKAASAFCDPPPLLVNHESDFIYLGFFDQRVVRPINERFKK